jgi:hypothetical protein
MLQISLKQSVALIFLSLSIFQIPYKPYESELY